MSGEFGWRPQSVADVAQELHAIDVHMSDKPMPTWDDLSAAGRAQYAAHAEADIAAGRIRLGEGWSNVE